MRIGVGQQARVLGPHICAPHLSPSEEESLLGRKSVDISLRFAFQGFFVGGIGNGETAQIGYAFAEHELAVLVQAGLDFVAIELLLDAGGALVEILTVFGRPPVSQVPLGVELRAGIVKAVSDFMADDRARSEEHTSELQSHVNLVCRLLLEKKKK